MKKIIYVTKADLPYTAAGIRIDGIMRILEPLGYSFTIICDREFDATVQEQALKLGATVTIQTSEKVELAYQNRIYIYNPLKTGSKLQALFNLWELRFAKRLFKRVKNCCLEEKADSVILYNDTYALTKQMLGFARKKGIKLFADVTEWYEKKSRLSSLGERIVPYLVNRRICKLDKNLDGIISISPYLQEYYTSIGCRSLMIPPLMPEFYLQPIREGLPTVVYAGSPGEKDLLLPAIQAVMAVNTHGIRLRLKLIGISEKNLEKICGNIDYAVNGIEVYGRLPHADTLAIIDECDFGILFRQNKRYAKAGFSTKLAECMSRSVPMICNRVGGCDSVVEDGIDGFVIEDFDKDNIIKVFLKISELSVEERTALKKNAFIKAKELFADEKYNQILKNFLEE